MSWQWQDTYACIDTAVLPECLPLQVFIEAQVGHAGDNETDEQHDKVPEGTQQLRRALNSELCCGLPQAHHDAQTDCHEVYSGPLYVA